MFSAVTMSQLTVVFLESDSRPVLRALGELGAVQLRRAAPGSETAPLPAPDHSRALAQCDQLLARVRELRERLGPADAASGSSEDRELTLTQAEAYLQRLGERVDERIAQRRRLTRRQEELAAVGTQIAGYRGVELPLEGADRFTFLHFVTGSVSEKGLPRLESELGPDMALMPLDIEHGRRRVVAITTLARQSTLEGLLERAEFQPQHLPIIPGATVDTLVDANAHEEAGVVDELRQQDQQLRALSSEAAPMLAAIERWVVTERALLDAAQHCPRSETVAVLRGWLPADRGAEVERRLREITGGRCVIQTAPPDNLPGEQVPVLLRHPRLLRPFELLVTVYGLPRYAELEPTLVVGLTYLLMFGFMFGDVGHGAILCLAGTGLLRLGRSMRARDAGWLVLFAGCSSIIFGVIYGSCFGVEQFKPYALWHDPLEGDPITLMVSAIGFGMALITLGVILNIINHLRRGEVRRGFLDKFGLAGLVFYWGCIVVATQYDALQSGGWLVLGMVVLVALPIVAWILSEMLGETAGPRENRGILFAQSLVEAFEGVLSYFANTVSFVRLAAYAMSHAAVLVAAFSMAAEVRHLPAGGVLAVVIIVLGNLVAIILEGIIASVQALRLEYYEFFSKFFSGSGEAFRPFQLAAGMAVHRSLGGAGQDGGGTHA